MCRAFKKPSPNYRQGFEAWNAYYVRDNSQVRPPSFSDIVSTTQVFNPNQAATFHEPNTSVQQELVCNHTLLNNQLFELPQLDSPSLSTSLATKEGFQHNGIANEDFDGISSQYVDWTNLDNLLASQFTGTTSFSNPNLPLISQNNELDAQNNASHLLGCFPEL